MSIKRSQHGRHVCGVLCQRDQRPAMSASIDAASATEDADGFLAVCLRHEVDQLDGMFWLQRLSRLKRERLVKKFEKMARGL